MVTVRQASPSSEGVAHGRMKAAGGLAAIGAGGAHAGGGHDPERRFRSALAMLNGTLRRNRPMGWPHLVVAVFLAVNDPTRAAQGDAAEVEKEPAMRPEDIAWSKSFEASLRDSASPRERALGTKTGLEPWSEATAATRGRQLREAAEAAPADPLVQSMWAIASDAEAGCDARSPCPGRRLAHARVEPGNAVAWIAAFPEAGEKASEAEVEDVLEKMATADRADDHFVESFRAWNDIYSARPLAPGLQREPSQYHGQPKQAVQVAAVAAAAAMVGSNWRPVLKACRSKEQAQAPSRRFELCAQAGRVFMRNGTSFLTESLGYSLVRNSGLVRAEDRLQRRRSQWRQQAMATLAEVFDKPQEADLYFNDLLDTGMEARAVELLMQRHGIPIEPPADWQAPSSGD